MLEMGNRSCEVRSTIVIRTHDLSEFKNIPKYLFVITVKSINSSLASTANEIRPREILQNGVFLQFVAEYGVPQFNYTLVTVNHTTIKEYTL